jgi:hypothetical protein
MTQRRVGDGRQRAAPSQPLLEVSGEGGGDRQPASFDRVVGCHHCKWAEREAGTTGQHWTQATSGLWPRGRGRPQAQVAIGELWPVKGGKKGPARSSGQAEDRKKGPTRSSGQAEDRKKGPAWA